MSKKFCAQTVWRWGLVLTILVCLLVPLGVAYGQGGTWTECPIPDFMTMRYVDINGTYPANMVFCVNDIALIYSNIVVNGNWACDSAIIQNIWYPTQAGFGEFYGLYPTTQPFPSGVANVRFQFMADTVYVHNYNIDVRFTSFTGQNNYVGTESVRISGFPYVLSMDGERIYFVDLQLPVAEGGYISFYVEAPTGPYDAYLVRWSGVKIKDSNYTMEPFCIVESQTPTPTWTPSPTTTATPTPTPTGTATHTPDPSITPSDTPVNTPTSSTSTATITRTPSPSPTYPIYATSAGGTPTIMPSATRRVIGTIAAPSTATRLNVPNMPTISVPGYGVPTLVSLGTAEPFEEIFLTPNGTIQANRTAIAVYSANSSAVISDWYTMTNWAGGIFSTTVTNTTGLSNVVEIAGTIGGSVAVPLTYIRALPDYVPNLWPLILFLLLAMGWILFTLSLKFAISIIGSLLEVVRRLIELIPGF